MRIESLEINMQWPKDVQLQHLRLLVLEKLRAYGEPLRWAITEITFIERLDCPRHLCIEAVVIIS